MYKRENYIEFVCAPGRPSLEFPPEGGMIINVYYACRAQGELVPSCLLEYFRGV